MNDRLQPTDQANRVITLDIIRGFALLGILFVNMRFFSTPELFTMLADVTLFKGTVSEGANWLITIFASGKFFTTFSFLFGLGFFLFMERVAEKGLSVPRLFSRRMLFLLVVGLIHAVVLWSGDILLPYAIAGLFLLLFREKNLESIKKWAIGLFVTVIAIFGLLTYLNSVLEVIMDMDGELTAIYENLIQEALVVYQTGSFLDILSFRLAEEVPLIIMNLFVMVPLVLSIFLFGLYVGKKGVLKDIPGHIPWIRKVWKRSFLFGWGLVAIYVLLKAEFFLLPFYLHETVLEVLSLVSGLIVSFFYITSLTLLCQKEQWLGRMKMLAPVGQMAFTNYLMQTVICLFIFNSFGLGLYGSVTPEQGLLITVVIFAVQIIYSHLWLKKYKMGPAEKLWRNFTYK